MTGSLRSPHQNPRPENSAAIAKATRQTTVGEQGVEREVIDYDTDILHT